jgi:hypothetical protein
MNQNTYVRFYHIARTVNPPFVELDTILQASNLNDINNRLTKQEDREA